MSHSELQRRLLYILHRGLVEGRLLAQAQNHEQLYKLCDVLEPIPGLIDRIDDLNIEVFRGELAAYKRMFPISPVKYLEYLDSELPPERF